MNVDFFPQNLRYLLNTNQITTKKILEITKIKSPSMITAWKNGEKQITTKDLLAISNYVGYTIDDLINKDLTKQQDDIYNRTQVLFSKANELLSDSDRATIEFIIKRTIEEHEKNKLK